MIHHDSVRVPRSKAFIHSRGWLCVASVHVRILVVGMVRTRQVESEQIGGRATDERRKNYLAQSEAAKNNITGSCCKT